MAPTGAAGSAERPSSAPPSLSLRDQAPETGTWAGAGGEEEAACLPLGDEEACAPGVHQPPSALDLTDAAISQSYPVVTQGARARAGRRRQWRGGVLRVQRAACVRACPPACQGAEGTRGVHQQRPAVWCYSLTCAWTLPPAQPTRSRPLHAWLQAPSRAPRTPHASCCPTKPTMCLTLRWTLVGGRGVGGWAGGQQALTAGNQVEGQLASGRRPSAPLTLAPPTLAHFKVARSSSSSTLAGRGRRRRQTATPCRRPPLPPLQWRAPLPMSSRARTMEVGCLLRRVCTHSSPPPPSLMVAVPLPALAHPPVFPPPSLLGKLHFVKFETSKLEECMQFIETKGGRECQCVCVCGGCAA